MEKKNVAIYGLGNFYRQNEEKINAIYYVTALIDREKKGWHAGKEIMRPDQLAQCAYEKILVMIQDIQESIHVSQKLIREGVSADDILLGCGQFGQYRDRIEEISVLPDGRLLLTFQNTSLKVRSKDEFNNVCEIFWDQSYDYCLNNEKKDIILDVGMNVGGAALYFALRDRVDKIYGYEPFKETFLAARDNLKEYLANGRVEILNYGISKENDVRTVGYNEDMTCGQSTLYDVREKAYDSYKRWGLVKESKERTEEITVRKASEVFEPIMARYPDHNIILKLDCEGEEYGILHELCSSGLLDKCSFIMLEWHYQGKESILDDLRAAGMSWWCCDKNQEMGLIYAYKACIV